jgi:hypothetical protein
VLLLGRNLPPFVEAVSHDEKALVALPCVGKRLR